jgi:hypothetical protein
MKHGTAQESRRHKVFVNKRNGVGARSGGFHRSERCPKKPKRRKKRGLRVAARLVDFMAARSCSTEESVAKGYNQFEIQQVLDQSFQIVVR